MNPIKNDKFEKALAFVLRWEGGYANVTGDLGGETNKGITHSVYSDYRKNKNLAPRSVKNLSEGELKDIYFSRYWNPAGCELLPAKLALMHFDWAVNGGVGRAVKTLQMVVYAQADGIFGSKTKECVFRALQTQGEIAVCSKYATLRENSYKKFALVPSQKKFLQGWLNRLNDVRSHIEIG